MSERLIAWSEFEAAEKRKIGRYVENENMGAIGATNCERWQFSNGMIVRAEWSNGGVSFFVEKEKETLE